MVKKTDSTEEKIVAVEEVLGRTEQFIEKHNRILFIVLGSIIVVILLYFGFKRFYLMPREDKAQAAMFFAERYFEKDSFNLALNGDGQSLGFKDIIDDYGMTKSSNLARYYAGICYLNTKDYESAIKHLKKFKSKDKIVSSMALGAIGDAYLELKDTKKGLSFYLKAADKNSNDFVTPTFLMKAGWIYEIDKDWEKALKTFERIKKEYPRSSEAMTVDKHIVRAKVMLGK